MSTSATVWPQLGTTVTLEDGITVIDADGRVLVLTAEVLELLRTRQLLTYDPRLEPTTSPDEGPSGHALEHILAGAQEVDGDKLAIDYVPTNYTRTTDALGDNVKHAVAHLKGIDTQVGVLLDAVGSAITTAEHHATRHLRGDVDAIDADLLDVDYSPTNYTRAASTPVSSNAEHLAGHLSGIDTALSPFLVYVTEAGATHTFALSDAFKTINSTGGSAATFTIPLNATIPYQVGTVIRFLWSGVGRPTIAAAGTLIAPDGAKISAQNKFVFAEQTAIDTWLLSGSCAA
jgi:hypothetical protein